MTTSPKHQLNESLNHASVYVSSLVVIAQSHSRLTGNSWFRTARAIETAAAAQTVVDLPLCRDQDHGAEQLVQFDDHLTCTAR